MPTVKKATSTVKVTSDIEVTKKPAVKKVGGLVVSMYSLIGKETGTLDLPKEVFGAKVSKDLLAQAMRVYLYNQKTHTASTKTRGEVHGTTAKWYRQKGTGRARHGAQTAPIFVGGGVAFGPRFKKVSLDLPKKMKKAAIVSALSDKTLDGKVVGVSGLDKATGKTKEMASLVNKLKAKSLLIITGEKIGAATRAAKNLQNIMILPYSQVNSYEIVRHGVLALTKEAVESFSSKKQSTNKENLEEKGKKISSPKARTGQSVNATK